MGNCINALLERNMSGLYRLHRFRYHVGRGFIGKGDTVLDVGSGGGYGAEMYKDIAFRTIGIELKQAEVDCAIKNHPGIEFICGDLETMVLPQCDVATGFEIIEHLYKPYEFIQKLKSVTKKYIAFSVPIGEHLLPNEQTVDGDSCHHSVFSSGSEIMAMFVDENWSEFVSVQMGVTFLGVVYNNNAIS